MADLAHILKKTEQRSKTLPKPKHVVRIAEGPRPYDEEAKAFQNSTSIGHKTIFNQAQSGTTKPNQSINRAQQGTKCSCARLRSYLCPIEQRFVPD
jgi:hypothetical protein